ncbi:MAG: ribonuclease HII [Candidatus Nanoarchaeia archaeon]|nr:ribonuclease HII [Candidatus Nanoarchaeia archaeon]MDD5239390.1 ribonuclease HII [Candidatus Nanoarchaeia archaeon]
MEDPFILGIDEAGKGPVIGPLVIVGAVFRKSQQKQLLKMGVKDSKLLTPHKREELLPKIEKICQRFKLISVSPQEIDQRFSIGSNLNKLEAAKFAELINELKPDIAIIDCPSANTKGFAAYLSKFLTHECELRCENYADRNHLEVGAASIIAKVNRDAAIKEIEKEVGMPVGIGYPSDPVTLKFVEATLNNKEIISRYVRKTWLTFQNIKNSKEQKKLGDFE